MAVVAKPEVEIWRRPKNELFDHGFLFTPSDTFLLGRTVLSQYKTSQTTDDTLYTKGTTDSTVGQKTDQHCAARCRFHKCVAICIALH